MSKKQQTLLQKMYERYHGYRVTDVSLLKYLKVFIPEIIYRSTKLEGENISRKKILSIF